MNEPDTPHPAELCVTRALAQVEDYMRREPVKAIAAALGAGLLLKVLPARAVIRPLTTLATLLLPPALTGLGLVKAFELCYEATGHPAKDPAATKPR